MLLLNVVELNRKCGFLFEEDLDLHKDSPADMAHAEQLYNESARYRLGALLSGIRTPSDFAGILYKNRISFICYGTADAWDEDASHTWHYRSVHDPTLFDVLTLADGISPP